MLTILDFERVINVSGKEVFKAGDIGKALSGFEVLNPDLVICHLDPSASFSITLLSTKGSRMGSRGRKPHPDDVNDTIAIDSIYTPIKNVKYTVDNFRVDQKTDYDKLTLEITTNGSILPKDALKEAAKILIYHFMLFSEEKITLETSRTDSNEEFDEEVLHMRQLLKSKLVDMDLSVRALNCLKSAEVETLGELVSSTRPTCLNSATSVRSRSLSLMTCSQASTCRSGWIFPVQIR